MTALRIGFLFRRPYGAGHVSIFPKTMQALADAGVVVDVIAANGRLIDLSTVRVEHDLYVLKQISGISMSLAGVRSEEHTSELQSRSDLVCRLLLEKKKNKNDYGDS